MVREEKSDIYSNPVTETGVVLIADKGIHTPLDFDAYLNVRPQPPRLFWNNRKNL